MRTLALSRSRFLAAVVFTLSVVPFGVNAVSCISNIDDLIRICSLIARGIVLRKHLPCILFPHLRMVSGLCCVAGGFENVSQYILRYFISPHLLSIAVSSQNAVMLTSNS